MINVGHDHNNDYCATCFGTILCYGGGVGFKTYGKAGFKKRLRIINIDENITTWKRLYDDKLTKIDQQLIAKI